MFINFAVTCATLNVSNGSIMYDKPSVENGRYLVDTVANYTCNNGYVNIDNNSAVCYSSGIWDGSDFACTGNKNEIFFVLILTN